MPVTSKTHTRRSWCEEATRIFPAALGLLRKLGRGTPHAGRSLTLRRSFGSKIANLLFLASESFSPDAHAPAVQLYNVVSDVAQAKTGLLPLMSYHAGPLRCQ